MDDAPQKFPPEGWFAAVAEGHPQRVAFRDINGETEFVRAEWIEENVFWLRQLLLLLDGVCINDFDARGGDDMSDTEREASRLKELAPRLVEEADAGALLDTARAALRGDADVFARAVGFALDADAASLELSFISLYAALESTLTFFRRQYEYEILPAEDFARLERDLKGWLRSHPLLEGDPARRGLIYEKVRELNRFPFSQVFKTFCEHHRLDLSDLWPLVGRADEWPLMEIRHRLVHGDPFRSRPVESVECAREHLRWTVERMILSVAGWPVERSRVSPEALARRAAYINWREERARLA